jgi:hypothetical protein
LPVTIALPSIAVAFAVGLLVGPLIWSTAHITAPLAFALDKATTKGLGDATAVVMVDAERGCRLSETAFQVAVIGKVQAVTLDEWPGEELCLPAKRHFRWESLGGQDLCRHRIRYTVGE